MDEQQTLIGTVAAVVFQNEENGYAVVRIVTDDGELITVTGCIPCAAPGEALAATGNSSKTAQKLVLFMFQPPTPTFNSNFTWPLA